MFCDDDRAVDQKEREGDEEENNTEDKSGYENKGVQRS